MPLPAAAAKMQLTWEQRSDADSIRGAPWSRAAGAGKTMSVTFRFR